MISAGRRSPFTAWQKLGDETVVVNLRTGTAAGLNSLAGYIWEQLEELSLDDFASKLAQRFHVPEAEAATDVIACLSDFRQLGLLADE